MTWPNLLASLFRPVGKPATRKLQTNGKGRERSTQEGDERQDGVERGSKGGMRQRRSSCGCTVNHDEVKDEMRGTRNTGGEKIYNARRRREVGRLECLIFESRYTPPPSERNCNIQPWSPCRSLCKCIYRRDVTRILT